jgi:hypothetical protein
VYYFILKIAVVAGQAWRDGPETKYSMFNNRFACPDCINKILKMIMGITACTEVFIFIKGHVNTAAFPWYYSSFTVL